MEQPHGSCDLGVTWNWRPPLKCWQRTRNYAARSGKMLAPIFWIGTLGASMPSTYLRGFLRHEICPSSCQLDAKLFRYSVESILPRESSQDDESQRWKRSDDRGGVFHESQDRGRGDPACRGVRNCPSIGTGALGR